MTTPEETAIICMVCGAEQTHRVCDQCHAVDVVVEMGRVVPACRHGRNTWCSCKVRDLAERMVAAGWSPPRNGSLSEQP